MNVNDIIWGINVGILVSQLVLILLILSTYAATRFTRVGKLLSSVALLFYAQSIVLSLSSMYWWSDYRLDYHVSVPLLISNILGFFGILLLYLVSRI